MLCTHRARSTCCCCRHTMHICLGNGKSLGSSIGLYLHTSYIDVVLPCICIASCECSVQLGPCWIVDAPALLQSGSKQNKFTSKHAIQLSPRRGLRCCRLLTDPVVG
jgi:hypothetical protein